MLRKIAATAALAFAALSLVVPTASGATLVYAGVYPSNEEAHKACAVGLEQGRWSDCAYTLIGPGGATELWVAPR